MAKIITAVELAQITSGLLNCTHPAAIDESAVFQSFMTDLAQLVCQYCGGEVSSKATLNPEMATSEGPCEWTVAIRANDSLPEDGGVWAEFDIQGSLRADASESQECEV